MIQRVVPILVSVIVFGSGCFTVPETTADGPIDDGIASDERVILFPTDGWRAKDGSKWWIRIHGWMFEPEKGDIVNELVIEWAMSYFDSNVMNDRRRKRFAERFRHFIADNEGGKKLTVRIAGKRFLMPKTDGDGRFQTTISLPEETVQRHADGDTLIARILSGSENRSSPTGTIHLMEPEGITVISDIDDTIKISNVHDRTELLRRTFLLPYEPVPGMAEKYRSWAKREDVQLIYLSSSPWQLYPPLKTFMDRFGFPAGPFDLLRVQLDDPRLFNLFDSAEDKKRSRLMTYLWRYPRRSVVLIGDSGERDPEVYGEVARQFPEQVRAIYIRWVKGGRPTTKERFRNAFEQVPDEKWHVFEDLDFLSLP